MNIARPWDCEAFPKSKTICYGGGGGGGGDPITNVVETVTKPIHETGTKVTEGIQDLSNQISDNTQDLKITDTSTQDIVNTVSDVIPDVKIIPEDLTSVLPGADDVQSVTALTEGIHKKVDLISNTVSQVTPDIKIIPEDLSDSISDVTPDFKNTTTSTQDLVEQIPTVPEILTKVDETGDAAATFVKGGVQAAADAGTAIAKPFVDAYTGSDLDTVLQQAEDAANLILNYKGGTTSPDPTGTVQNIINTNPLQDITDAVVDNAESLVNVPVPTSPQPTVAAGDVPGGPIASPEETIVGITQRNRQMMSGRRKTMLTVGQSAAKIRARQTGY